MCLCAGEVRDGVVCIGDASMSVCSHNAAAMVPDVLFYDNDLVRLKYLVTSAWGH